MRSPAFVEIDDVHKVYQVSERLGWFRSRRREVRALSGVSLHVERGELLGLLGPNGAGKTTLIKCLTTLLLPSSGTIKVGGHDVVRQTAQVALQMGCMISGERGLYWKLTGRENLAYFAALYFLSPRERDARIGFLIERLGLAGFVDRTVETYSCGQRIKVALARALINDASLIVLDEPTNALDVHAARELRQLIRELHHEGRTILLSTHLRAEAEDLCTRVAIVDGGRIIAVGAPAAMLAELGGDRELALQGDLPPGFAEAAAALPGVTSVVPGASGTDLSVHCRTPEAVLAQLFELAPAQHATITGINVVSRTLEDLFVQLTANSGRGPAAREREAPAVAPALASTVGGNT